MKPKKKQISSDKHWFASDPTKMCWMKTCHALKDLSAAFTNGPYVKQQPCKKEIRISSRVKRAVACSQTTHIWFILVMLAYFPRNSIARPSDCAPRLRNCTEMVRPFLHDLKYMFPTTINDVDNMCKMWSDFVDCVRRYTKDCATQEQRNRFNQAVGDSVDTVHAICSSDKYQKEYLQSASCFRKVSVDNCGSHYNDLVEEVTNAVANNDHICCSYSKFRSCVSEPLLRLCGSRARTIMDHSMDFLIHRCSSKSFSLSYECPKSRGRVVFNESLTDAVPSTLAPSHTDMLPPTVVRSTFPTVTMTSSDQHDLRSDFMEGFIRASGSPGSVSPSSGSPWGSSFSSDSSGSPANGSGDRNRRLGAHADFAGDQSRKSKMSSSTNHNRSLGSSGFISSSSSSNIGRAGSSLFGSSMDYSSVSGTVSQTSSGRDRSPNSGRSNRPHSFASSRLQRNYESVGSSASLICANCLRTTLALVLFVLAIL
ncbi:uncharacterized protein LOC111263205 [Varroa jacobsoni]|uniref:uncharacterized protein LOC111263205 n=1 Tax=Varroa jacobsoni TaxID=62625 RepID=UPI000BF77946|nr:uncharacterized protein LOC111263205 [Varroa jacobsoni]